MASTCVAQKRDDALTRCRQRQDQRAGGHDHDFNSKNGITYADAGVDIDAGNTLVERIKPAAKRTASGPARCRGWVASARLFDLKGAGFTDPVLVAATDGVGTKLRIAIDTGNVDSIGIDLVAMCVNDLVCQGAEPLFFLDYFATGKLEARQKPRASSRALQRGCEAVRLRADRRRDGRDARHVFTTGDFDLAGFAVGAMERGARSLPRTRCRGRRIAGACPATVCIPTATRLVRKIVELMSGLGWDAMIAPLPMERWAPRC